MKKALRIAALLLAGYSASAQKDLAYKIPKNAYAVASLRTDQLFSLLSVQEFNESKIGRELMKNLSGYRNSDGSIRDIGVSLSSPIYYYNRRTDSVSFHCVLLPLENAQKLDRFIKNKGEKVTNDGNMRMVQTSDHEKMAFMWNDEFALLVMADLKRPFFEKEENKARYGNWGYYDFSPSDYGTTTTVDSTMVVESITPPVEAPPPPPLRYPKAHIAKGSNNHRPSHTAVVAPPPPMIEEVEEQDVHRLDKGKLATEWAGAYAAKVFNRSEDASSILDNERYRRSADDQAVASLYISDMQGIYGDLMSSFYGRKMGSFMRGYGSVNANLYLDKYTARLTTQLELDDRKAEMYRRIYDHRINPEFARYVNSDRIIGFAGYSLDTKAYLEEMPKILQQTYGHYFKAMGKNYQEEMSLGADFFSLLLDEEAVARVVKGDALLLFNGVSTREVSYTTYDYNSDTYERKEVEKTKTETLPDFLFMMSSDDVRLIRKLLSYGIDKGQITLRNDIYTASSKLMKTPMPVHLMIRNGIIFIGTSLRDLQDIRDDRYEGHISKGQKSLLLDNNMSLFFNPRNLEGRIPQTEIGSLRKWNSFNTFLGKTGVMYAKSSGIHGNVISGEIVAEVPDGNKNALTYFFSMIEDLAR